VQVNDIIFDDASRIREDLDESSLQELVESFKNVGQITPIVITRDLKLVAGRRRLEAARRASWTHIRAEFLEELPALTRKIIEFDETTNDVTDVAGGGPCHQRDSRPQNRICKTGRCSVDRLRHRSRPRPLRREGFRGPCPCRFS